MQDFKREEIWSTYAHLYNKITPTVLSELHEYIANQASGRVLDIGAGCGKIADLLVNKKSVTEYLGMEPDAEMRRYGEFRCSSINSGKFRMSGASIAEIDGSWDTAILCNVLYAVDNPVLILDEIYRKLKPGGRLILSTPSTRFDLATLIALADREFPVSSALHQDYLEFKQCNVYLTSDFSPKLYNSCELALLLLGLEFDIIRLRTDHFAGGNVSIVAQK